MTEETEKRAEDKHDNDRIPSYFSPLVVVDCANKPYLLLFHLDNGDIHSSSSGERDTEFEFSVASRLVQ